MNRLLTTILLSASMATPGMAQTSHNLFALTEDDFEQGDTAPYHFEMYTREDGGFATLSTFGDSCMANYVDIYNPERLQGERITEIDGVEANGTNTWAANMRPARYMQQYTSPVTSLDLVYVCQDLREGFGYELYGTSAYSSAITFEVPADGYYVATGTIIRQDHPALDSLYLKPIYRYATQADNAQRADMGIAIGYGGHGGELDSYSGNCHLNNGAEQRYYEEVATDFTFAFNAQAGDKVALIVDSLDYATRDCWARSFVRALCYTLTDEQTAQGNEHYADPYDQTAVDKLIALLDSLSDVVSAYEKGSGYGQYPADAINAFYEAYSDVLEAYDAGDINPMNAAYYEEDLWAAMEALEAQRVDFDFEATANYRLYHSTGSIDDGDLAVAYDEDDFLANDDNPWGFRCYTEATGQYERFAYHDSSNKSGQTAWYNSSSQWLYVCDYGEMHPLSASVDPAITFTAQADGVYKVYADAYRYKSTSSNTPLTFTSRFIGDGQASCDSALYIQQKHYGGKDDDGANGFAPVALEYFVNMAAGDMLTFEVGAPNGNGSANTQVMNLTICSRLNDNLIFTADSAKRSGLPFYDPYTPVDDDAKEALEDAMAEAYELVEAVGEDFGEEDGLYGEDELNALLELLTEAEALYADDDATQVDVDTMVSQLGKAVSALKASRKGYHLMPEGDYSIVVAQTDKHLTRKNMASAGTFYYAGFLTYSEALAYATANADLEEVTDMSWTFHIAPYSHVEDLDEDGVDETTLTSDTQLWITCDTGWLTRHGYVSTGSGTGSMAANVLEFITQEEGDSLFAIRTADGDYWLGSTTWVSPYDKVDTSDTPAYIFTLGTATLADTNAEATTVESACPTTAPTVVRSERFTLDGRRASANATGIILIRQTLSDGTVKVVKTLRH